MYEVERTKKLVRLFSVFRRENFLIFFPKDLESWIASLIIPGIRESLKRLNDNLASVSRNFSTISL